MALCSMKSFLDLVKDSRSMKISLDLVKDTLHADLKFAAGYGLKISADSR